MIHAAQTIADDASFQAFANAYLLEVDRGTWSSAASWQSTTGLRLARGESHVVELELAPRGRRLAFGVGYRSKVGRHTLTDVFERESGDATWTKLDPVSAEIRLIDSIYAPRPESPARLELLGRVVESHQRMTDYVRHALEAPASGRSASGFIESERAITFGHWLHPTPKSRQGMHAWQHEHFAPELAGSFRLQFFAARRALVLQDSLLDVSAEALSLRIARRDPEPARVERLVAELGDDYCLVPVHPMQGQWLLHQEAIRTRLATRDLVDLGQLGPEFTPTSSVRTLYAESEELMLKLSMPVKITNSLRVNLRRELDLSVAVSRFVRDCDLDRDFPELATIEDPAYISVALEGLEESGFEAIFRSNPFGERADAARSVHSICALIQEPLVAPRRSILSTVVRGYAERADLPLPEASRRWFEAYLRCALETPVRLYDRHGIALEAHQQNTLLELGPQGFPERAFYRDIQGLTISEDFRAESIARTPALETTPKVFEGDAHIRRGLGYYLLVNQLSAMINRFGLDGLLDESTLVELTRHRLAELRGSMSRHGIELVDSWLERKVLPCKGNLLTRVADRDELTAENQLAVYTMIDNPLAPTSVPKRTAESVSRDRESRSAPSEELP